MGKLTESIPIKLRYQYKPIHDNKHEKEYFETITNRYFAQSLLSLILKYVDIKSTEGVDGIITKELKFEISVRSERCADKPPIGITPKWLWKERRAWDLIECLARHRQEQSIPGEWFNDLRQLLNEIRIPSATDQAQFCAWRLSDEKDNYWNSGCGTEWFFCEHGPKENRFNFCPTCGKEIVIDE